MKVGYFIVPAFLLGLVALVCCQTRGNLKKDIVGEWTSVPDRVSVGGSYYAAMTRSFTFLPDGKVTVTANIEIDKSLPDNGEIAEPVSLNTSAVAEMSGSYKVKSADVIELTLDPSSFNVTVDPSAIQYVYNGLTGEESPELTKLRPQYADSLAHELNPVAKAYLLGVKEITRIHVVDSSMECTLAGKNLILTRPSF